MTKTFPATRINEFRRRGSKAAQPAEACPEGLSISTVHPMSVLAVFKPLRIKKGCVLRAYQFHSGGNGNGFVWAMPVDADFPDPDDYPRLRGRFFEPAEAPASLDDVIVTGWKQARLGLF